jgi:hypothetical protein
MLKARLEALQNQYDDEVRDHEDDRTKMESHILKLNEFHLKIKGKSEVQ